MTDMSTPVTAHWVLNAPGMIDGHNTGLGLRNGSAKPEDKTFELKVTDDRYATSGSFDDEVPVVVVACHMLEYGPEATYPNNVVEVAMRFRQAPGQVHELDIPDEFELNARFIAGHDPDSAYIVPVRA